MKLSPDIKGVFFCSGARNQSLLNEFSSIPLYMEIDERIASFKALGLGKATNKVVIICTTSGTAVSECLSAFIEAFYSEVSLLLISADRPLKLRGSGSPQTIDHEVITRGFRRDYKDITFEEFQELDLSSISYPAHINVRITSNDENGENKTTEYGSFLTFMKSVQNPLFIFSHETQQMRSLIKKFIPYGLPFYAEVSSGAKDLSPIKTEKKLLELFNAGEFDGVVRIGHTPLSKLWRILEGKRLPIYNFDSRGLRGLSHGNVQNISISELENFGPFWEALPTKERHFEDKTFFQLHELCQKYPLAEVSIFKKIHDLLPENAKVFLGNSLPIRYFELVQSKPFEIMANRGVNGIDGQLATAIGCSLYSEEIIYCILGDMTFSYDISSLAGMTKNIKCIIINNSGGRIFEILNMDQRLVMEHNRSFKKACEAYDIEHSYSLNDLNRSQVIEVLTDLNQGREFLQEWNS